MKNFKVILVVVFMFISGGSFAQIGLTGGINITNWNYESLGNLPVSSEFGLGYNIGVNYKKGLGEDEWFSATLGPRFCINTFTVAEHNRNYRLNSIALPVEFLIKAFDVNNNGFFIGGGLTIDYMFRGTASAGGKSVEVSFGEGTSDFMRPMSFVISGIVGMEYDNIRFGLYYEEQMNDGTPVTVEGTRTFMKNLRLQVTVFLPDLF